LIHFYKHFEIDKIKAMCLKLIQWRIYKLILGGEVELQKTLPYGLYTPVIVTSYNNILNICHLILNEQNNNIFFLYVKGYLLFIRENIAVLKITDNGIEIMLTV